MPSHTHTTHTHGYSGGESLQYGEHYGQGGSQNSGATGGGGSHTHGNTGSTTPGATGATTPGNGGSTTPGATGSNGSHSHTISAPQYIDVIICSKDA